MTAFVWFFFLVLQWAYVVSQIVGNHLEELTNYDLESDLRRANVDAKKIGYTTVNVAGKEMAVNLWANKGQLPAAMCEAQTQTCDDVFVYIFPGKEEAGDDLRAEEIRSEKLIASGAESHSPDTRCAKEQQELATVKPIANFAEDYFSNLHKAFSALRNSYPHAVGTGCMMVLAFQSGPSYAHHVWNTIKVCTHNHPEQVLPIQYSQFLECLAQKKLNDRRLAKYIEQIERSLRFNAVREFVNFMFRSLALKKDDDPRNPVNMPRLVKIVEFTSLGGCDFNTQMQILLCLICRWDATFVARYQDHSFELMAYAAMAVVKLDKVTRQFLEGKGISGQKVDEVANWKRLCDAYKIRDDDKYFGLMSS